MSKLKVSAQEGRVLVMVLIILCLGALLIPTFLSHSSTNLLATQATEEDMKEQYAADAGVAYAVGHLLYGEEPEEDGWDGWSAEFEINNKAVTVTIVFVAQNQDGQAYRIASTATSDDVSNTIIESYVWRNYFGEIDFIDGGFEDGWPTNVSARGDIELGGSAVIEGNASAGGNMELGESAVIEGDAYAGGDMELGKSGHIEGDAYAAGNMELGESGGIKGNACAGGDIELGKSGQIEGDVYVTGDINKIELWESATIKGSVYVLGNINEIELGKSAAIVGDVYVTGDINKITLWESAKIKGEGDPNYSAGVYATGVITQVILGESAEIVGGWQSSYSGGYPDPPECPEPLGISILVW